MGCFLFFFFFLLLFFATTTPPGGGEEGQSDSGSVSTEVRSHRGASATLVEGELAEGGGGMGYAWRRSWRRVDFGGTSYETLLFVPWKLLP